MKFQVQLRVLATLLLVSGLLHTRAQDCTPPTATITATTPVCAGDAVSLTLSQATGQPPYELVVNNSTYTNVTKGQVFATIPVTATETSIWGETGTPENPNGKDAQPNGIEVGVKFRSAVAGFVTGVRFYKGSDNDGTNNTHIGRLYTADGQLLAEATFSNETASGWQQVHFNQVVSIKPNVTYVATYYSPSGYFAITPGGLNSAVTTGPLTALASGTDGRNGVYRYGGGFPVTGSDIHPNYWVDVLFAKSKASTAYTLTSITDAAGCTNTGASLSVATVTFNPPPAGTVSVSAQPCEHQPVSLTFHASAGTAPYTLDINNQTYTGVLNGESFTTGITAVAPQPFSIWDNTSPNGLASDDAKAVTLGVKFRTAVAGKISGIRFYKTAANTGTHTGALWLQNPDNSGTLLAAATFTTETATGWQQVNFPTPVSVAANTTYVASYHAPNGQYIYTSDFFTNQSVTKGPVTMLASGTDGANGVYIYDAANAFPFYSFYNSNYWVDVVFTTDDDIPLQVTRIADANGCAVSGDNLQWLTATVAQCTVTPVTLVSFNGRVEGTDVRLNWTTQTEIRNHGFDIQRSSDGGSWKTIGFVAGNGNSTTLHQYSYTDRNVAPGRYQYRLRQVDVDERATYSQVVALSIGNPDVYNLEQNYPNPVTGETIIQFTHPQTEQVNLRLFDASGRLVNVLLNSTLEKGAHSVRVNGKSLRPGVYYYKMETRNFTAVKKLTVQ